MRDNTQDEMKVLNRIALSPHALLSDPISGTKDCTTGKTRSAHCTQEKKRSNEVDARLG